MRRFEAKESNQNDPPKPIYFDLGEYPEEKRIADETGEKVLMVAPKDPFERKAEVNGFTIQVNWCNDQFVYCICISKVGNGAHEEVIQINRKGCEARNIFKKAKKIAEKAENVEELFIKVHDLVDEGGM